MLQAIIGGMTDLEEVVKLIHRGTVNKHDHKNIKVITTGLPPEPSSRSLNG